MTTVIMTVVSAAMPPMLLTNCAELVFTGGVVVTPVWPAKQSRAAGVTLC
ncbi:hypothetical protein [Nocardia sp. NPDC002869]